MFELIQLTEHDYYVENLTRVGLICREEGAYLIDSGLDKEAGKKLLRLMEGQGLSLRAVLHTHAHADHIGGSRYLREKTGCAVYVPHAELSFAKAPILEPALLWGAYPPAALRHKFLLAPAVDAMPLCDQCLPAGVEQIPLGGHFLGQVGYRTEEGTVYIGDAVSGENTIEKYGIVYNFNIEEYLESLHRLEQLEGERFVAAHVPPMEHIGPLVQKNRKIAFATAETILSYLEEPTTFEALLAQLFFHYGLHMNDEQYALIGSATRSFLSWLRDTGRVEASFSENKMYWVRVPAGA